MHPTLVRESFNRDRWVYEEKYDGWHIVPYKYGDRARLVSRNGRDHTARFADIAHTVAELPARTLILDGEVCAFDASLVSHIYLVEASPGEPATPPVLMALDCLYQRGRDLRDRPLAYRRSVLEDAVAGAGLIYAARRLHPHGLDAWAEVKQSGYEGLVAKREASVYRGGPTREWLKVKVRHEGRFTVVGLDVPLERSCALLLAARVGRRPVYVGRCEWGVSRRLVTELRERLKARPTPACTAVDRMLGVTWVEPQVGVEVQYNEMMRGKLRDPVLRRLGKPTDFCTIAPGCRPPMCACWYTACIVTSAGQCTAYNVTQEVQNEAIFRFDRRRFVGGACCGGRRCACGTLRRRRSGGGADLEGARYRRVEVDLRQHGHERELERLRLGWRIRQRLGQRLRQRQHERQHELAGALGESVDG
jgi:bifunctional non-homologous end joining protein LigD